MSAFRSPLDLDDVRRDRFTPIGRLRLVYRAIGSTNDLARDLLRAGYPHGTVVVADYQTAGRGRQGRRWEAPPGSALLFSTIVRPDIAAAALPALSMAAALATSDVVAVVTGASAGLKWPNDVLIGQPPRKVAGLLVESVLSAERVDGAIIGIGVNISASPTDLATATHLTAETSHSVDRAEVLDCLLAYLDAWLAWLPAAATETPRPLFLAWRERLMTLGSTVRVAEGDRSYAATALDVEPNGALIVRLADQSTRRVLAADVTLSHAFAAAEREVSDVVDHGEGNDPPGTPYQEGIGPPMQIPP